MDGCILVWFNCGGGVPVVTKPVPEITSKNLQKLWVVVSGSENSRGGICSYNRGFEYRY